MIVEPAQQLYGHELALFPLVLAQIFIAAQLHLSSFYQAMTGKVIIRLFFNGRERRQSLQTMAQIHPESHLWQITLDTFNIFP